MRLNIYDDLIESIKKIDTENISDEINPDLKVDIVEKQKIFFWIRVFIKEELSNLELGDNFSMKYLPMNEEITTKFITFGKKNLNRDLDNVIVNFDPEDDKKCLILMVDEDDIKSDKTKFIRTLFKTSPYYEYQVYRRSDLTFTNVRTNDTIDYIDLIT